MILTMVTALRADLVKDSASTADIMNSQTAEPIVVTGTVRKITVNHGNLITTIKAADMTALGIAVGSNFTLKIDETEYQTRYGKTYEDVTAGDWVAVAKDGELIWIARNGQNAAVTSKAKVGTTVKIHPLLARE